MKQLFKYLPVERIDVLENLKIRMSPLKSLNDPYERILKVDFSAAFSYGASELERLIKASRELKVFHSENELNQYVELFSQKFQTTLREQTSSTGLADNLGDRWGILSLSRIYDSLLMWSHYADRASGYLIGFDCSHPFFNRVSAMGRPVKPVPVNYTNTKPRITPTLNHEKGGVLELSQDDTNLLLASKATEWSYEQEERLMFNLEFSGSENLDPLGQRIYLETIPSEAITKIIIGSEASGDTRAKILDAIQKHSLSCELFQAKLSSHTYTLDFERLSY